MNRIIRTGLIIVFLFILVLISSSRVRALSISISNLPESIDRDQETEVNLFFGCAGCGDYSYMRGVFYPSGTKYFGFTQNNSGNWTGTATDRSLYFTIAKVDLIDASWSGKLKIKPDSNDSAYTGPGEYLFKVGRYTSANDSSADWSNELAIKITGPTPTPSSTPTPTPTATPTPTPTKTATPTPSPTKTSTPTLSKTPTPTPSPTESPGEQLSSVSGMVLGVKDGLIDSSSSPKSTPSLVSGNKNTIIAIVFISLGVILIGGSIYLVLKTSKSSRLQNDI